MIRKYGMRVIAKYIPDLKKNTGSHIALNSVESIYVEKIPIVSSSSLLLSVLNSIRLRITSLFHVSSCLTDRNIHLSKDLI